MRGSDEGLRSEALRTALATALAGKPAALIDLFCRHGGGPDPKPNLKLAAAFGTEVGLFAGAAAKLLSRLGADDAAPDTREVFLPIAAAYGWVGRLRAGRDEAAAWAALAELAADERGPVRVGTLDALSAFALRDGGARLLVGAASEWLNTESLEQRLATAALVVQVLSDRRVLAGLADSPVLLDYLTRVIDEAANAPRSSERSAERRRLMAALPRTLSAVVTALTAGERGLRWLAAECEGAQRPDVRAVLSDAVVGLRGSSATVLETLRQAMAGSAKPLRDPSRVRKGTDRGKASRRLR